MIKVPIVFTFTNSFIIPAYIAIESLVKNANKNTKYEIIIIHYNLSFINKKHLFCTVRNSKHILRFIKIKQEQFRKFPYSDKWPQIVYIRLFLHDILKKYDKVIYSDVDVLFLGDLSEVYQSDISEYEWGGIKAETNHKKMVGHQYFPENLNSFIFMSGFMLCNLKKFRENNISKQIIFNLKNNKGKLFMFDLDLLNLSTTQILELPFRYSYLIDLYERKNIQQAYEFKYLKRIYTLEYLKQEKKATVIIHFAGGKGKPWLINNPICSYKTYLKNLPCDLKLIYLKNRSKKSIKKLFSN